MQIPPPHAIIRKRGRAGVQRSRDAAITARLECLDTKGLSILDWPVNPSGFQQMFSVIQRRLEDPVTRGQLEQASDHAPSIARADCVRMHAMLAGIFISRLPREEAIAFQRGLAGQGIESDVVPDTELPELPVGMRSMRVNRIDHAFHFRDFMDRLTIIPQTELLFVAAGCIEDSRLKRTTRNVMNTTGYGTSFPFQEQQLNVIAERSVRIDVFFGRPPYRFSFSVGEASRFMIDDQPVYLHNPEDIGRAFRQVRDWVPAAARTNSLIRLGQPGSRRVPFAVYQSEIRWRFYRLRESG